MSTEEKKEKKESEGLGIALGLLLSATIFIYFPELAGWSSLWKTIFNVLSIVLLAISVGGAGIELEKLIKNEGWSDLGIGLLFFIPAIAAFFWIENNQTVNGTSEVIVEAIVLLFIVIFAFAVGMAVPKLLMIERKKTERPKKQKAKIFGSIIIGGLSLTLLILQIVNQILQMTAGKK